MLCDYMKQITNNKFKPNHYYLVDHSCNCIIKTIRRLNTYNSYYGKLWKIEIIKIFNNHSIYHDGQITSWFEDWCTISKEFKNIHDNAEVLAYVL